mmetsp:Transcript_30396/g.69980  ORF Transcript_30396/g.69980 Transcript_30396/m.69980 type:complete len:115 (+) Transcript_30396:110-454(+)
MIISIVRSSPPLETPPMDARLPPLRIVKETVDIDSSPVPPRGALRGLSAGNAGRVLPARKGKYEALRLALASTVRVSPAAPPLSSMPSSWLAGLVGLVGFSVEVLRLDGLVQML